MRLNAARPVVLAWAAWALAEAARQSSNARAKVAALGGLEVAVQAMALHAGHTGLQEQCCALLATVAAGSAEGAEAGLKCGGVGAAAAALRGGLALRAPAVVAAACWALGALAGGREEAAEEARAAGARALAQQAAEEYGGHAAVAAHAARALAVLAMAHG